MTLGERIRACRQRAGLSQEQLAALVGVSRQAVTKWETDQSAPSTGNLFRLAEIFDTTVDLLLAEEEAQTAQPPAAAAEEPAPRRDWAGRIRFALLTAGGYLAVYLLGRVIWCDLGECSLLGWLFTARPSGTHSYLYGWLLSSRLFWYAMAISALPALLGKRRFPAATALGFLVGLAAGILFGPDPVGAAWGHGDRGWLIWGGCYLASMAAGLYLERREKRCSRRRA